MGIFFELIVRKFKDENHKIETSSTCISFINSSIWAPSLKGLQLENQRATSNAILNQMMQLSVSNLAHIQPKAIVNLTLKKLYLDFENSMNTEKDINEKAFLTFMVDTMNRFSDDPGEWKVNETLPLSDGSPIGSGLSCGLNE